MEIGSKLKQARQTAGLTQEQAAEHIAVSRQTMSSWENNKSYPDIISVIKLSDLYGLTLDELVKGDQGMMEHLDNTTNEVKTRQKHARQMQVLVYLVIWAACVLVFWLGGWAEAMLYSLAVLWLILPVTTIVVSVFIGKDDGWNGSKWLMLLFFGFMYMMAAWSTFLLANAVSSDKVNWPELTAMLPGLLCSAVGMMIGTGLRTWEKARSRTSP